MQYQRFVDEVQRRGHLASPEASRRAIETTLTRLAERVTPDAADELAAQLPPEIGRFLRNPEHRNQAPSLDQWLATVALREEDRTGGAGHASANDHAAAVLTVLRSALSPGMARNIEAQLPQEFRTLWQGG